MRFVLLLLAAFGTLVEAIDRDALERHWNTGDRRHWSGHSTGRGRVPPHTGNVDELAEAKRLAYIRKFGGVSRDTSSIHGAEEGTRRSTTVPNTRGRPQIPEREGNVRTTYTWSRGPTDFHVENTRRHDVHIGRSTHLSGRRNETQSPINRRPFDLPGGSGNVKPAVETGRHMGFLERSDDIRRPNPNNRRPVPHPERREGVRRLETPPKTLPSIDLWQAKLESYRRRQELRNETRQIPNVREPEHHVNSSRQFGHDQHYDQQYNRSYYRGSDRRHHGEHGNHEEHHSRHDPQHERHHTRPQSMGFDPSRYHGEHPQHDRRHHTYHGHQLIPHHPHEDNDRDGRHHSNGDSSESTGSEETGGDVDMRRLFSYAHAGTKDAERLLREWHTNYRRYFGTNQRPTHSWDMPTSRLVPYHGPSRLPYRHPVGRYYGFESFYRGFPTHSGVGSSTGSRGSSSEEEGLAIHGRGKHPEHPSYRVNCVSSSGYEVRDYEQAVWITTIVNSSVYEAASMIGYRRLHGYMSGRNSQRVKIDMTTPVRKRVTRELKRDCYRNILYSVSFFLPPKFWANPPEPLDDKVTIEISTSYVYAYNFSGRAFESRVKVIYNKLRDLLEEEDEPVIDNEFYVQGYDTPGMSFNRHNDILIPVDTHSAKPACDEPTPTMTTDTIQTEFPTDATVQTEFFTETTIPTIVSTDDTTQTGFSTHNTIQTGFPTDDTTRTGLPTDTTIQTGFPTDDTTRTDLPTDTTIQTGFSTDDTTQTRFPTDDTTQTRFPTDDTIQKEFSNDIRQCGGHECPIFIERGPLFKNAMIREVGPGVYASKWSTSCNLSSVMTETFRPLRQYFRGSNEEGIIIPRTVPVLQLGVALGDDRYNCDYTYQTSFYIPEIHQENPPTPLDETLIISRTTKAMYAVLKFDEDPTPKIAFEKYSALKNFLNENGFCFIPGRFRLAFYDAPRRPRPHLYEVWIPLDKSCLSNVVEDFDETLFPKTDDGDIIVPFINGHSKPIEYRVE